MKKYSLFASLIFLMLLLCSSGCPEDYTEMAGDCIENETYNEATETCECEEGYERVDDECVPKSEVCPENSTYDETTETCVCEEGFILVNDECVADDNSACSDNAYFDEVTQQCECNQSYVENPDGDCVFFNLESLHGLYEVQQECDASGADHYFINVEELFNQPDLISVVGLFGFIEFSTLRFNEDKTGADFQEGEIIGGQTAIGGVSWDVDNTGNVSNITLSAEYGSETCTGTWDKIEAGDQPCGPNTSVVNLQCQCNEGYTTNQATGECVAVNFFGDYDIDQSCNGFGDSEYVVTFQEDVFQLDPNFIAITNLFQTGQSIRCAYKSDLSGFTVDDNQFLDGGQLPGVSIISGEGDWTLQSDGSITDVTFTYQTDIGETCTANLMAQ